MDAAAWKKGSEVVLDSCRMFKGGVQIAAGLGLGLTNESE